MPPNEERTPPARFRYRPALDGVRGLAVAAVVAFHVGVPGISGGFLGVDAFFVLSGYLITSLLLTEASTNGRIALGAFWARRARRLLPALLVTLIGVAVAGRALLIPDDLALLRGDAVAALAYVANWRMIYRGTGYFAATATPSPLQHTWSLGIEEQFYVIWPLLLAAAIAVFAARRAPGANTEGAARAVGAARAAGRTRRAVLVFAVAGTVVSVAEMAALYRPDATDRDYFGTDTRAQALLIGAGLAALLGPGREPGQHRGGSRHLVLGALAAAGIMVSVWLWHGANGTDAMMYRGGFTVAALAVAAVIAHASVSPRSPTARVLAVAPLVWLGRISYGVYLYHWPLFQFLDADRTGWHGLTLMAARLAATLGVAVLSFFLLEEPIRHGVLSRRLPRGAPVAVTTAAFGATAVALVLTTSVVAAPTGPAPAVAISVVPRPLASKSGGPLVPMDRPGRRSGTEPRVTFFGDSVSWTVGTYLPAHPGLSVTVRAVEGCGIATLPDILELGTPHTNYPGCTTWYNRWQKGVKTDDPDVSVILLNRWELMDRRLGGVYQHVGDPAYDTYLLGQLDRAVTIVGSRGAAVVLLTASYTHRAEKPDGSLYGEDQPARVDAWNHLLGVERARHPHQVTILNLAKVTCPNGTFTWTVDGLRIRSDGLHFTPAGDQRIIAPWLLPRLAEIAAGRYPS